MTDPVLTEDEKDALLEGMATGQIEVHSTRGPGYASVAPFEIGPRSRINTNTYPRLQSLNRQFATRMCKQAESLLNADATVTFLGVDACTYSEFSERSSLLSLIVEFAPKPLDGPALINLDATTVEHLVETFYGGLGNEPARHEPEFFTPGEISVAALFGDAVLNVINDVWQPLEKIAAERVGTHLSTGVIDSIESGDSVICCEFELEVAEQKQGFHLLWPVRTVASLLPVFEGQKRDRDPAEDARWGRSLRSRVTDSVVRISSNVGRTQMTLREVAELSAGDVISISNPRKGTVLAGTVPVLEGRFGVHDGRYAIETTRWFEPDVGPPASTAT